MTYWISHVPEFVHKWTTCGAFGTQGEFWLVLWTTGGAFGAQTECCLAVVLTGVKVSYWRWFELHAFGLLVELSRHRPILDAESIRDFLICGTYSPKDRGHVRQHEKRRCKNSERCVGWHLRREVDARDYEVAIGYVDLFRKQSGRDELLQWIQVWRGRWCARLLGNEL